MSQIEKEWLILVCIDEPDCLITVALGDGALIGGSFDDFIVSMQRNIPVLELRLEKGIPALGALVVTIHVIGIRDTKPLIEPVSVR